MRHSVAKTNDLNEIMLEFLVKELFYHQQ